jgi:hypothetical protein
MMMTRFIEIGNGMTVEESFKRAKMDLEERWVYDYLQKLSIRDNCGEISLFYVEDEA